MITTDNKKVIERYFEEINLGNLGVLDELCAPDLVHHTTHSPEPLYGLDKVKPLAASYHSAFPDLHYQLDHVIAEGDLVVVRWTAEGHHRGSFQGILPTGKRCVISGMTINRVVEGKIVERWVLNDDLSMVRQFGLPRWLLAIAVLSCVLPRYAYYQLKKVLAGLQK